MNEFNALWEGCDAEALIASLRCSALIPEGPGAEPALKLLMAFLTSELLMIGGGSSMSSTGVSASSACGCLTIIASLASSED